MNSQFKTCLSESLIITTVLEILVLYSESAEFNQNYTPLIFVGKDLALPTTNAC